MRNQTLEDLITRVNPKLYYPQTSQQQTNITDSCRNCLYIDHQTQKMCYINAYGMSVEVPSHYLKTTKCTIDDKKHVDIEYQLPNHQTSSTFRVSPPKIVSLEQYGTVIQMTETQMRAWIIPPEFQTDLLFKYSDNLLRGLKREPTLFSRATSLFVQNKSDQKLESILAIVEQFTTTAPVLDIRKYKNKPNSVTCPEDANGVYVFVENDSDPDKSGFYYVDKHNKWIEFPIKTDQILQIIMLFGGAATFEKPEKMDEREDAWYKLGKKYQLRRIPDNLEYLWIRLTPDDCKKVVDLLVSPLPFGENLAEDWSYNEAFDRLTNTLLVNQSKSENSEIVGRCQKIQKILCYFSNIFFFQKG
jgi:hypothetical protein